jgi:fucose permease
MQTTTRAVGQSPEPVNPYAKRYIIAWALALVFYFLEYAARSSPAVMIPELSTAFGATAVGVSAIIGTYYYTYSVTNLVAGVALDRTGGKWVIAIGAFVLAAGCFGFAVSSSLAANVGRLLPCLHLLLIASPWIASCRRCLT